MTEEEKRVIAIVGGGAAGLMSAVAAALAAEEGDIPPLKIIILERQARVGRKLLATGNGRCNLTNRVMSSRFYHGADLRSLSRSLDAFGAEETVEIFRKMGLLVREEEGRVYPYSNQASAVLDVLRFQGRDLGVEELCHHDVVSIEIGDRVCPEAPRETRPSFRLICASGISFTADRVIVAGGGLAGPQLGSDGGGYRLLQALGHRYIPAFPTLVSLKTAQEKIRGLQGIRVEAEARLAASATGEILRRERGEVLFTTYGLSGIAIMQLSRWVGETDLSVTLILDLVPDTALRDLILLLKDRRRRHPGRKLGEFLIGIVPKRIGQVLLQQAGVEILNRAVLSLTDEEIAGIAGQLKEWRFRVTGTRSWEHAQATAGGIALGDFDPVTMESRITPGLYAAGEILDADGDCGGYNLQWAWTSGFLAGRAAARSLADRAAPRSLAGRAAPKCTGGPG